MEKFVIEGGVPLSGELTVAGNKNAALPILAACLLTEEEVLLHRVPRIRDTEAQIALLENLGVTVEWVGDNSVKLCAAGVSDPVVDEELSSQIRASFLLAGPLLARFGAAKMPPPGGDFIGRRRLDAHLDAFTDLGARVDGSRWIELSAPTGLCACEIFMDEPSVMGTENALMAAALTPGQTTISNAASEPHVQDLARLLTLMGAEVEGVGSNVMIVNGQTALGGAEFTICPDHIEVGSFMALAAATGGELRIRDAGPRDLRNVRRQFRRLGLQLRGRGGGRDRPRRAEAGDRTGPRRRDPEDRGRPLARLPGRPHLDRPRPRHPGRRRDPDLREDVREPLCSSSTSSSRWALGSRCATPTGRSSAVRAGFTASAPPAPTSAPGWRSSSPPCAAEGRSEIGDIHQIDRGYEQIDERLRGLGAQHRARLAD